MGKGKRKKTPSVAPQNGADVPADEAKDIEETRAALQPLLAHDVSPHRIASSCGAHPDDLRGFLEGRVSLTWALRARLRATAPSILEGLDPRRGGGD